MVIHKIESRERKDGRQQPWLVIDCKNHWHKLNNKSHLHYTIVMNMKTYRFNNEHYCWMALTYHFNPNKW